VVVITEALARKYFPTEDPIGKYLTLGVTHDSAGTNTEVRAEGQIVGVVNDVRQRRLNEEPTPALYVGWGTFPLTDISFVVRSSNEASTIAAAIRDRVRAVDAQMPIYDLRTMEEAVSDSVAQPRFYMTLLSAFAALALLLAALGFMA
jgi:hypothetical protein